MKLNIQAFKNRYQSYRPLIWHKFLFRLIYLLIAVMFSCSEKDLDKHIIDQCKLKNQMAKKNEYKNSSKGLKEFDDLNKIDFTDIMQVEDLNINSKVRSLVEREYNAYEDKGNLKYHFPKRVSSYSFSPEGKLLEKERDWSIDRGKVRYEYDNNGNIAKETYYSSRDLDIDRIYIYKYNRHNSLTETSLIVDKELDFKKSYVYDEKNIIIEETENSKYVNDRIQYIYDTNMYKIEKKEYDSHNRLENIKYTNNNKGQVIEEKQYRFWYDSLKLSVTIRNSYYPNGIIAKTIRTDYYLKHQNVFLYNEYGMMTKEMYYNFDNIIDSLLLYSVYVSQYDKNNNLIKEETYSSYDSNGAKSILRHEWYYDKGKLIKELRYDSEGYLNEEFKYLYNNLDLPDLALRFNSNETLTGSYFYYYDEPDQNGNWLRKILFFNNKVATITKREIQYY